MCCQVLSELWFHFIFFCIGAAISCKTDVHFRGLELIPRHIRILPDAWCIWSTSTDNSNVQRLHSCESDSQRLSSAVGGVRANGRLKNSKDMVVDMLDYSPDLCLGTYLVLIFWFHRCGEGSPVFVYLAGLMCMAVAIGLHTWLILMVLTIVYYQYLTFTAGSMSKELAALGTSSTRSDPDKQERMKAIRLSAQVLAIEYFQKATRERNRSRWSCVKITI